MSADDYPVSCPNNGQGCADIYAVSISGVIPSSRILWFQAQQACFNARKRLPSNAEWQGAVAGTPDPGPDNGTTDCNTDSVHAAVNTGLRSACVSRFGAFDMVGNLGEWVADLVPRSINCGSWSISDDAQCLQGVITSGLTEPGAIVRGFGFASPVAAGPFAIQGAFQPSESGSALGFRCAR